MKPFLTLEKIQLAYGSEPLLDQVNFQITAGERVCLIGRNGAGKSSFLKVVSGEIQPDSGKVFRDQSLQIARLTQELPKQEAITVYQAIAAGLEKTGNLLEQYHALVNNLDDSPAMMQRLEGLQHQIDACDGWQFENQIQTVLTKLDLPADKKITELSGGWLRRVALAKVLVMKPDILLLDEPTNHLDVNCIQWLEEQLLNFKGAILFITHDRSLLRRLATRIIELDRGKLTSWPGDYDNFLRRKEELLAAEERANAEFDKKLAIEEQWIRQGIKARRTRNEGRVRALEDLRRERRARRELQGSSQLELSEATRSGKLVIAAEKISHQFNGKPIVSYFSKRFMRGEKIGLLGENGVGKTTLLNILLKKVQPQQGTVTHGTKLEIAYFDQLRAKLDPEKSILDNVAEGRTSVIINDKEKHIISYLSDFLFPPERIHTPVKALSGGECNRVVMAKLFSQPINLLVLDEPTNDLDLETLELLEEILLNFQGTLLLVSHDRAFLDNVVTSLFVFEGQGMISEYIGGYSDWSLQKQAVIPKVIVKKESTMVSSLSKLTPSEQQELKKLPKLIERLEEEQALLMEKMAEPGFYQQESKVINDVVLQMKKIESELNKAYARWEALEKSL